MKTSFNIIKITSTQTKNKKKKLKEELSSQFQNGRESTYNKHLKMQAFRKKCLEFKLLYFFFLLFRSFAFLFFFKLFCFGFGFGFGILFSIF